MSDAPIRPCRIASSTMTPDWKPVPLMMIGVWPPVDPADGKMAVIKGGEDAQKQAGAVCVS